MIFWVSIVEIVGELLLLRLLAQPDRPEERTDFLSLYQAPKSVLVGELASLLFGSLVARCTSKDVETHQVFDESLRLLQMLRKKSQLQRPKTMKAWLRHNQACQTTPEPLNFQICEQVGNRPYHPPPPPPFTLGACNRTPVAQTDGV